MSKVDALLITPPSRFEVYQDLSKDYAAIEPPVWSALTANYLIKKGYAAQILDAEAENLSHNQTAEKIGETTVSKQKERLRENSRISIAGRPNIDEISKRNEEIANQERKKFYKVAGIIVLLIIAIIFLLYFFS